MGNTADRKRVLVLNGSPAGKNSVTLQTVEYLKVFFPGLIYETLHVGQKIRSLEKDFSDAKEKLLQADLILFCYPVYTFLVPAQLHRFLELMKENGVDVSGKYATQLSTSKHFYDITAHRFIEDFCADAGLRYVRGLSADMEDILTKKGQQEARDFFRYVLWNMENGFAEPVRGAASRKGFVPVMAASVLKNPEENGKAEESAPGTGKEKTVHKMSDKRHGEKALRIALVTDLAEGEESAPLSAMITRFREQFPGECEFVNLHTFPFQGGCLGCFHCASDGTCVYKDGFDSYLREHINSADAVVYAYTIKDHSMGYRFKLYDDRQFCNGHRTVTMGKPEGYLVDGDLDGEENLRTLMEARSQVGGNFLAGIASDQKDPDAEIDQLIKTLTYAITRHYNPPKNFYGVGGLKIFRDLIYEMQGLMKEDHRFYKAHGFYDFPQKKKGRIAGMYLVSSLMNNKKLMKKSKMTMTDGMLMPYKKVIEKAKKSSRP